jgi:hypothetical protein
MIHGEYEEHQASDLFVLFVRSVDHSNVIDRASVREKGNEHE